MQGVNRMKYRKKPVEIEAWQSFKDAGTKTDVWPRWIISALREQVIFNNGDEVYIRTLEGDMHVSDGDWIIKGINGELYPCKPDIFELTYDAIDND